MIPKRVVISGAGGILFNMQPACFGGPSLPSIPVGFAPTKTTELFKFGSQTAFQKYLGTTTRSFWNVGCPREFKFCPPAWKIMTLL